jgi:hypothetical protein
VDSPRRSAVHYGTADPSATGGRGPRNHHRRPGGSTVRVPHDHAHSLASSQCGPTDSRSCCRSSGRPRPRLALLTPAGSATCPSGRRPVTRCPSRTRHVSVATGASSLADNRFPLAASTERGQQRGPETHGLHRSTGVRSTFEDADLGRAFGTPRCR